MDVKSKHQKLPSKIRKYHELIQKLAKDTDCIIKNADKGGNLVLWPTKLYKEEAMSQLNDTTTYMKITKEKVNEIKSKYKIELSD